MVGDRKLPIDVKTKQPAKSNDAKTWSTLTMARLAGGQLGFVFAENGGLFGIDLDGCLVEGELDHWAAQVVRELETYAEISPSGTGIKIYGRGKLATEKGKKRPIATPGIVGGKQPAIEAYDHGRYFCFTGNHWKDSPFAVNDCQSALDEIVNRFWPPEPKRERTVTKPIANARNIYERAAKYMDFVTPAISGQGGHNATFNAACVLVLGFNLSVDESLPLLESWNCRCNPPWSEKDLIYKLRSADKQSGERGYLLTEIQPKKEQKMASFNKTIVMGNLTRDVELRYLQSGTAVCDLSLAVNEKFKDKASGQMKEEVSFIDVTCWGRTAEVAGEYLSKGSNVLIEGKLKQERWEKDGTKHSKIKIVCEQMTMLSNGGKREANDQQEEPIPSPQRQQSYAPPHDEIPF
jgi:single-strand DNA-binding protein